MRAPGEAPGLDGARDRDGRDGRKARHGSGRVPHPERHAGRSGKSRQATSPRAPSSSVCAMAPSASAGARGTPQPGQVREGHWLIGMGMAGAIRGAPIAKAGARARLDRRGIVTVETDMTDIGTGSYTIVQQTAAEMMGVPLDKVVAKLGDSSFPETPGSGGQQGAPSVTAGVYAACMKLREAVAQRLGFNAADAEFTDGEVRSGNRSVPLARAARRRRPRRRGQHGVRRSGEALRDPDLRRAFRRGRRERLYRRNPGSSHARGVRRRPHPQPQDRPQPGDRRDDDGHRRRADGRDGRRQAVWLLRQPRSRRLRSARSRGYSASRGPSSSTRSIRRSRRSRRRVSANWA